MISFGVWFLVFVGGFGGCLFGRVGMWCLIGFFGGCGGCGFVDFCGVVLVLWFCCCCVSLVCLFGFC